MKKSKFGRVIAFVLALTMAVSCFAVTALAADHAKTGANPVIKAFKVDKNSFIKIEEVAGSNPVEYEIIFAERDIDGTYDAIPAEYILESGYNDGTAYAAYVDNGELKFIPVDDCNNNNGQLEVYHGTESSATVSVATDEANNADPSMGTDFYLNIENGIDPDGMTVEESKTVASEDERVDYEITMQTKTTYQLKATVPMYVCMYGYRGTGTVVTPDSDAYQIKNYSTIKNDDSATIVDIVMLTKYSQILDQDHSDELIQLIAYKKAETADGSTDTGSANGEYKWFYTMPTDGEITALEDDDWTVNKDVAGLKLNASGQVYVCYINGAWDFKAAGVLDNGVFRKEVKAVEVPILKAAFELNGWTFSTAPKVGDAGTKEGTASEGLAIKVTELQAIPATWRLVPVSTGISEIKRGELAMSIAPSAAISDASAIDLSTCSAPVDITDRGWFLAAPKTVEENGSVLEANATILPLITSARMAGGNVNAAGCTQVVKVIYTVTPMFAIDDGQTSTATAGSVASNRA